MTIRLDPSPVSVVVYCDECGHWRAFAWDREEGERAGEKHEELVHSEDWAFRRQVAKNRRLREARHAADSINAPRRPEHSSHGNHGLARSREAQV